MVERARERESEKRERQNSLSTSPTFKTPEELPQFTRLTGTHSHQYLEDETRETQGIIHGASCTQLNISVQICHAVVWWPCQTQACSVAASETTTASLLSSNRYESSEDGRDDHRLSVGQSRPHSKSANGTTQRSRPPLTNRKATYLKTCVKLYTNVAA